MIRATIVTGLLLALGASAVAAPKTARWHTDLGEARREAWERGVPMLVFLSRFT
jgi:hypothetical protein